MKSRNTEQKQMILNALKTDCYIECGAPPYTAPSVTHLMSIEHDMDFSINSVRRTLKTLEREGKVIVEIKPAEVLTGLGYIERPLAHYWNAETYQQDYEAAKEWNDGAVSRAENALKEMLKMGR